jgi:uncharacterized protein (DUF1015 family)
VAEETTLLGGPERGAAAELQGTADVVEEGSGDEQVAAKPWMHLRGLAADCRDGDGVLEQTAGVDVVGLRAGRKLTEPGAKALVREEPAHERLQPGVGDLAAEKLEEAVQLVGVPAHRGCQLGGVLALRVLDRPHVELEAVAELVHPAEDADSVTLAEARVEQLDVVPDPRLDLPTRVDELEGEVVGARLRPPTLLSSDRIRALDDAVLGEVGDRAHGPSLGRKQDGTVPLVAVVKPIRAVRYDESVAGPLEQLVAPPYDVIDEAEREELLARSPFNVVHLTLPEDEADAGRLWREWLSDGALVRDQRPSFWALEQQYVGPDGVERTRRGLVAALRVEPYENRVVLPHERTHAGPKEGRKRLLEALGAHAEPIFLLYDGEPPYEQPDGEPELVVEGTRLWRLPSEGIERAFADKQLLIADGHHRYETAIAFGAEHILVVLVSIQDPGLMIFPTHRIVESINGTSPTLELEDALAELDARPTDRAAAVVYRKGGAALVEGDEGTLDVQLVESLAPGPVSYTPSVEEAVAAVEQGRAEGAFIVRPTRIEDVFRFAQAGETLPQKTTYFYPKLLSGLLFLPLE